MAATDYYAPLSAIAADQGTDKTARKILYKLNTANDPKDPALLGYLSGDKLYSDPLLTVEVPAADIAQMGDRIIDRIPWSIATPQTRIDEPISLAYAKSVSTFHSVAGISGTPGLVTLSLYVSSSAAKPTAQSEFALYDAIAATQDFTEDVTQEQITVQVEPSLLWLAVVRVDDGSQGSASATASGYFVVLREVS